MLQRDELKPSKDLPPELLSQLTKRKQHGANPTHTVIAQLLAYYAPLTTDEVLVGLYEQTGKVFTRAAAGNHLARMKAKGLVAAAGHGKYQLTEKTAAAIAATAAKRPK